jgi:hypothetical protein
MTTLPMGELFYALRCPGLAPQYLRSTPYRGGVVVVYGAPWEAPGCFRLSVGRQGRPAPINGKRAGCRVIVARRSWPGRTGTVGALAGIGRRRRSSRPNRRQLPRGAFENGVATVRYLGAWARAVDDGGNIRPLSRHRSDATTDCGSAHVVKIDAVTTCLHDLAERYWLSLRPDLAHLLSA